MKKKTKFALGFALIIALGFVIPDRRAIPVQGASSADWNAQSFWYEPWGASGVHKGVDIFAKNRTPVIAPTDMMVVYRGQWPLGGKVVLALGPKWRLHYFAHMADFAPDAGVFLARGEPLGVVGDSGNAQGKPPHLHYSIVSLIPLPWRADDSTQGIKKMVYLDPIAYLEKITP